MTTPIARASPEQIEAKFGGVHAWAIWALAVGFLMLLSLQPGYAVTNIYIGRDLALTIAQVGVVSAVYTWIFAVCQFFGGALLDRLGAGRVLPACIGLVTLGTFLLANANSFGMLLVAQAVFALGACCGFVGAGYISGQWFGRHQFSFMFGLAQFAASMAIAFSMNLIGWLLGFLSWRALFNYVGLLGIVLTILGALFIRNPKPVEGRGLQDGIGAFALSVMRKLLAVGSIPHLWVATLITALTTAAFFWYGFVWGARLLIVRGLKEPAAVLGVSLGWIGFAIGAVAFTRLSDVLHQRKLPLILGTALQIAMALVIFYVSNLEPVALLGASFLMGFGASSAMLGYSTAADVIKPDQLGTSVAMINGFTFIISGFLMSRSVIVAQHAAVPIVIALTIALLFTFLIKETFPGFGQFRRRGD